MTHAERRKARYLLAQAIKAGDSIAHAACAAKCSHNNVRIACRENGVTIPRLFNVAIRPARAKIPGITGNGRSRVVLVAATLLTEPQATQAGIARRYSVSKQYVGQIANALREAGFLGTKTEAVTP